MRRRQICDWEFETQRKSELDEEITGFSLKPMIKHFEAGEQFYLGKFESGPAD